MDLRERRDGACGLIGASGVDQHPDCVLQVTDRLVRLVEEVAEAAEVVQQPADVLLVIDLLVQRAGSLGVVARGDPVAFALGDQRGLKVDVCGHAPVLESLRELERALYVLASRLVVALAAPAARAPVEDLRTQPVARESRASGRGRAARSRRAPPRCPGAPTLRRRASVARAPA